MLFFGLGCTRKPLKTREQALQRTGMPAYFTDDSGTQSLKEALGKQIRYFEKDPETWLTFGAKKISASAYLEALKTLRRFLDTSPSPARIQEELNRNFEWYEVYGGKRWGEVLLTSYYEPEVGGALAPSETFQAPLYAPPSDLLEVALSQYDDRFFDIGAMRGRLVPDPTSKKNRLVPYFTRRQIDREGAIKNRGLELCWVDSINAFFAHIQGSLTVILPDGKRLALNYADQNGHRYQSIGSFLKDLIPVEQMTATKLENQLRMMGPSDSSDLMHRNPSYIFFQKRDGFPQGSLGIEVTAGRTIAADGRFFPKGALAYLAFEKPVFETPQSPEPRAFEKTGRLVLDQDSGGAIRGGGRVDLYWGSGDLAKQSASVIRQTAKLYYLAPR